MNLFKAIITEIQAGEVLHPQDRYDEAWNAASERAVRIVRNYAKGKGIFSDEVNREKIGGTRRSDLEAASLRRKTKVTNIL